MPLHWKDRAVLAVLLLVAIFIGLSGHNLRQPGIQADEALFANGIYRTDHVPGFAWVFGHRLPLMVMPYVGALLAAGLRAAAISDDESKSPDSSSRDRYNRFHFGHTYWWISASPFHRSNPPKQALMYVFPNNDHHDLEVEPNVTSIAEIDFYLPLPVDDLRCAPRLRPPTLDVRAMDQYPDKMTRGTLCIPRYPPGCRDALAIYRRNDRNGGAL